MLESPQALTQNIMAQVEYLARHKRRCNVLRITGLLSGAAACLMLLLLVYEAAQLTLLRQEATKAAATRLARQARWDTSAAARSYAKESAEIDKAKIANAIKEKLSEYSRKKQRYAAARLRLGKNTGNPQKKGRL